MLNREFKSNWLKIINNNSNIQILDQPSNIKEIVRITNDLVWICVPNECKEHRHPVDCWRVFPDGMKFLLKNVGGLEIIRVERSRHKKEDTIGIAKKIKK